MEPKCFDEQVNAVRVNGAIPVHRKCFGYTFINKGSVAVTVNQTLLLPQPAPGLSGESYSYVDAEKAYYMQKQFLVTFAAGPNPFVEIHQYHEI